jgi:ADP-ribosyl-[dinitrogen reductase] hydrolase
MKPKIANEVEDRALGCFIGLAVGDALGTAVEFSERDSFEPITGMVGGGVFGLRPGEWTDDTSMAICLAESLLEHGDLDERDLMERFVRWWRQGENSVTGKCFDIGGTTRAALSRFASTGNPLAGSTDDRTAGNGSVMRLAPIALYWYRDIQVAIRAARRQSETTHAAVAAVEGSALLAEVLIDAIHTGDKTCALRERTFHESLTRLAGYASRARGQISSSGYVLHTLEAAFWAVHAADNFAAAVLTAVNLGGDADTVAAVTGQIAGALWGYSAIPEEWLATLAQRERLERLGLRLIRS